MPRPRGYKHTQETRDKMKISSAHSVAVRKGKPLSAEHRKKLSAVHIKNGDRPPVTGYGEENPNWRGGISYKVACKIVLGRDSYTCQICGLKDPDVMEIDHRLCRVLRPDLFQDLNNLWTLCANCHRRKTKNDWNLIKEHRAQNK